MSRLAPDLFDRRYPELVDIGRSQLPGLAPQWTDHNAHDPGIMLLELLAWVTEAQLYSLGRTRRDERRAYAALFDVVPEGARAARGLLWPDRNDPVSPYLTCTRSRVIGTDTVIHLLNDEAPVFHPAHPVLWAPGRIERLFTRAPGRADRDHLFANQRDGAGFVPFSRQAAAEVLVMQFRTGSDEGLFPAGSDARGARFVIGIRADAVTASDTAAGDAMPPCGMPIEAEMATADGRFPLALVEDTTGGLLATGALVFDLGAVRGSPRDFAIELRAPRGLPKPPRWLRIEPNVIPVTQSRSIVDELQKASGKPGFAFELAEASLAFAASDDCVAIRVRDAADTIAWHRCERLAEQGPRDAVFELDRERARVTFGNGINGRMPAAGADVLVSYRACDGEKGNIARNRRWEVQGFAGVFAVNPDPVGGGRDRTDALAMRREARRRSLEEHALVSAGDIVAAALALPLLDVARAWVPPVASGPTRGTITLVALRAREGEEPVEAPETPRWLEAIRRALAPRMPMATRLAVVAPRYATFRLVASVVMEAGRDAPVVEAAVRKQLRERLAVVAERPGVAVRLPGAPLGGRDLIAWIRGVEGVAQVASLALLDANGAAVEEVRVDDDGLPRIDWPGSVIKMQRAPRGGGNA